jgi:hypothetical protein
MVGVTTKKWRILEEFATAFLAFRVARSAFADGSLRGIERRAACTGAVQE